MEQPISSYVGRHAELFDLFYAEKPYAEEAYFAHECFQENGQGKIVRLLELACGTGTHAMHMEKLGYEVIATDYSHDMLAQAYRKALESGAKVDFRHQDMRNLDVPERPFDAVMCLFDSIGYVVTNENILGVFSGIHNHLRDGGLFLLEFWHAGAMLRSYEPLRIRRWQLPGAEILRISETRISYPEQLCYVTYRIYELRDDRTYQALQETQINRFFLLQEMASLLNQAGLKPLKWFNEFQHNNEINDKTWHIVVLAQKV
jgi:ubiquinone/menaquinone biosynthesis C-methylase UbiE